MNKNLNTDSKIKDSEGYLLISDDFVKKQFRHILSKKLDENWRIYKRFKEDGSALHFELVKIYKSEAYTISGITIGKKWNYPSSETWGIHGFTYPTENAAIEKYNKIIKNNGYNPRNL